MLAYAAGVAGLDTHKSSGTTGRERAGEQQAPNRCTGALSSRQAVPISSPSRELGDEVFGASIAGSPMPQTLPKLTKVIDLLEGQLTATLHLSDPRRRGRCRSPAATPARAKAGRVLANGWPTGVEVTWGHGSRRPVPRHSPTGAATSVGTLGDDAVPAPGLFPGSARLACCRRLCRRRTPGISRAGLTEPGEVRHDPFPCPISRYGARGSPRLIPMGPRFAVDSPRIRPSSSGYGRWRSTATLTELAAPGWATIDLAHVDPARRRSIIPIPRTSWSRHRADAPRFGRRPRPDAQGRGRGGATSPIRCGCS